MAKTEVAVLDFGSSKRTILVGQASVNGIIKIVASGVSDYAGFINGKFIEPDKLSSAIIYAKNQAEHTLGRKIKRLYVGVPTEFCVNRIEKISMNLNSRTKIKQKNLDKLFLNAPISYENFRIINKTPIYYLLDDNNKVFNPIGCYSSIISVLASFVLIDEQFYNYLDKVMCGVGVYTYELISAALCESLYLIEPENRQNGAIFIDCGFITTSVNAIYGEGVTDLKSFSIGGGHITGDLMEVLEIPFESAEQLKRKAILTLAATDEDYYETLIENSIVKFKARLVNEIILARIDEIVLAIEKCLDMFDNKLSDDIVIYLSGGGLNYFKGVAQYLENNLNRVVKLVAPQPLQYNKPTLSSVLGIMHTAISMESK